MNDVLVEYEKYGMDAAIVDITRKKVAAMSDRDLVNEVTYAVPSNYVLFGGLPLIFLTQDENLKNKYIRIFRIINKDISEFLGTPAPAQTLNTEDIKTTMSVFTSALGIPANNKVMNLAMEMVDQVAGTPEAASKLSTGQGLAEAMLRIQSQLQNRIHENAGDLEQDARSLMQKFAPPQAIESNIEDLE